MEIRGDGMAALYWLIALAVLILIEILTLGLTTIWFAGGALIAFFATLLGASIWIQFVLFLVVSIVLLIFTRPIAVKYFNKNRTKTNCESIIGKVARVTKAIDNNKDCGEAQIGGQLWTARSQTPDELIPAGNMVRVIGIEGVKLIVTMKGKEN